MKLKLKTYLRRLSKVFGALILAVLGLNFAFPLPLDKTEIASAQVLDRYDGWMSAFPIEDGIWRIPADLDQIDPRFIERLIRVEDKRYWDHHGVDGLAILRAANSWRQAGKPVSGASTITMQLVRQIEPRPRTLRAKILEAARALQYEAYLSKEEILQLYLTHISYGGNIEGLHAASLAYLGKQPHELSDDEIALLIALPQAPDSRRPDLRPEAAKKGRNKILKELERFELITEVESAEARALDVVIRKDPIPQKAWLTANAIKEPNKIITSTIDPYMQSDIEQIAQTYLEDHPKFVNMAITVIENETMAVRAHIGSGGRDRQAGWMDMTRRYRSPGSTLKPFIYGLAMDDGLLSASTLINDAPTRFGSYQPENFDGRYYGKVRIHEALRHSLNVPAVVVLDKVGSERFETRLDALGMDIARLGGASKDTGLALALGGAGITLNDLAVGYAALANDGKARPLRWREDDPTGEPVRFVSEKTADKITDILRQAPTPDGHVPGWLSDTAPIIAYKTGTSYGFRDAWAAGYTPEWTIVVWVGRPDGTPRDGITGRIAAAPILFEAMTALPRELDNSPFLADSEAPKGLKSVADYSDVAPQILFPPHKAELLSAEFGDQARGFTFSARAQNGDVRFYVNEKLIPDQKGTTIWRPETPGFYRVVAVDQKGRESVSRISVKNLYEIDDPRY